MNPGGSGVLLSDGEQLASPLDDLAAVPTGDPVHPLVEVRGPVERHRLGELRAPAMLAAKGAPPPGHHPMSARSPANRVTRYRRRPCPRGALPRRNPDAGLAGGHLRRSGMVRKSSYFRTL